MQRLQSFHACLAFYSIYTRTALAFFYYSRNALLHVKVADVKKTASLATGRDKLFYKTTESTYMLTIKPRYPPLC